MIQIILCAIIIIYILNKIKIKQNNVDDIKIKNKEKILKYGQIQYETINNNNYNDKTKYQNLNIPKKYDEVKLNNNNLLNFKKNTITNLPCQQDIIYDTRFFQPSDKDTYKPFDVNYSNYKERNIQDIYNDIVNNKKNNKTEIHNFNEFDNGASGLKTYKNVEWMYKEDNDEMAYDPNISSLSTY